MSQPTYNNDRTTGNCGYSSPAGPNVQDFQSGTSQETCSDRPHYRTDLNNIAKKYRLKLQYQDECRGPPHNCYWHSTALIGGIPFGFGSAPNKGSAHEAAAQQASEILRSQGFTP
ncbi:hypothetical protein E4T56_gene2362 [Termitomyces sp. T112]|nr:hypothetical protein E4T56_gene2362 [Termitomyces sp. T112]